MNVETIFITPNAEQIIEAAGRTCYKSKPKEGYKHGNLIQALIKSGHDSVLEHAHASFRLTGVSRSMTHQLVRHRLCSFSQESQRYVSAEKFPFIIPPSIENSEYRDDYFSDMDILRCMYAKWLGRKIKKEDARYVLPNACSSEIVITANLRQWRNLLKLRCDAKAQWEIREVAFIILGILSNHAPHIFDDLLIRFTGESRLEALELEALEKENHEKRNLG